MNRARTWVLIAAMSCFASGVAVGLVLPDLVKASPRTIWDADEQFVSHFIEELDLSSEQAETLRMILAARAEEEIRYIKQHVFEDLPEGMRTSLIAARSKADDRIQAILDETQRRRFQELMEQSDRWPKP